MKSIRFLIIGMSLCFLLVGCKETDEPTEEFPELTGEDLYDIYYLKEAPEASRGYELSEVIKIVVVKHEYSQDHVIAIDVEEGGIYVNPSVSSLGIRASKGLKEVDDVDQAVELLDVYNVQDWKEDYTTEDPKSYTDGIGWNVWIQYSDGAVQSFRGSGSGVENITPEDFVDFFDELNTFAEERLDEVAKE